MLGKRLSHSVWWKQCGEKQTTCVSSLQPPNTDSVLACGSAGTNMLHHALKLRSTFNEPQVQAPPPSRLIRLRWTWLQTVLMKQCLPAFKTHDSRSGGAFLFRYLELRDRDSGIGILVEHSQDQSLQLVADLRSAKKNTTSRECLVFVGTAFHPSARHNLQWMQMNVLHSRRTLLDNQSST